MRALAAEGLKVPGDVALVGFDDIPAASLTNPPLTTIMQDIRGAGERLVETLLAKLDARFARLEELAWYEITVENESQGYALFARTGSARPH